MAQPISQATGGHLPWLIRRNGRVAATVVASAIAYLATMSLPDELNLLIPYDVGVAVYLGLCCALMGRASAEDAAQISRRGEPHNAFVLIVANALAIAALIGVAAMLNPAPGRPRWEVNLHMA